MSGSTFGKIFRITTWGESHGSGIGVVIDGCPSGISLNEEDIQIFLDRRKPGQSKFTTRRSEEDTVEILSGIFEGKPEHRFLFSYVIKTNVPEIMETLFLCFVRGMRIILLRKNTASAITEEAGVLPVGKQSAVSQQARLPLKS